MPVVEGDLKAPFSVATTLKCRGGHYSFPWIAPLYPWYVPYNAECSARQYQVPFFKSLVWLDLRLNPDNQRKNFFFAGFVVMIRKGPGFSLQLVCMKKKDKIKLGSLRETTWKQKFFCLLSSHIKPTDPLYWSDYVFIVLWGWNQKHVTWINWTIS